MHLKMTTKIIVVTLIVAALTIPTPAQGGSLRTASVRVPAIGQRCPQWCWAAGLEMLARSQGVDINQEAFVSRVYGPSLPCAPSGNLETIVAALTGSYVTNDGRRIWMTSAYHYGMPTNIYAMIRSINEGRPFILAAGNHVYVVYGLNWLEYNGAPYQITQLNMIDPFYSLDGRPAYTTFVVGRDNPYAIQGTIELLVRR